MDIFKVIDKDNTGVIKKKDLASAFRKYQERVPDAQMTAIIEDIDTNGLPEINYSEFVMIACDQTFIEETMKLKESFEWAHKEYADKNDKPN